MANQVTFIWPVDGGPYIVTQGFAQNPKAYERFNLPGHDGLDLPAEFGQPIVALFDGEIFETSSQRKRGYNHSYGLHLRLKAKIGGVLIEATFAHLSSTAVKPGNIVRAGEIIGLAGNSGNVRPQPWPQNPTAGTHLHLSLKAIGHPAITPEGDPWPYNLVDPTPYFAELR